MTAIEHGGPDGGPEVVHDFSTNANPLGPPPAVLQALQSADRRRYPDPAYGALRARLSEWLGLPPERIVPTAGTSEAIHRLTLAAQRRGIGEAWLPQPGYGDYRAAAEAHGLAWRGYGSGEALLQGLGDAQAPVPVLVWLCEPCNPTGESLPATFWPALMAAAAHRPMALAIDRAYEPLRLQGSDPVPLEAAGRMWQCLSPNKSLGLTGVRAGCLLAPEADPLGLRPLIASLAPSWVLSAEGVAMLQALPLPETQAGLAEARPVLAAWAAAQRRMLDGFGWQQRESVTPFWLARPPWPDDQLPRRLARLRGQGIKLRDAASFGLPGWLRLSAQPPASQRALADALNLDWTDRR